MEEPQQRLEPAEEQTTIPTCPGTPGPGQRLPEGLHFGGPLPTGTSPPWALVEQDSWSQGFSPVARALPRWAALPGAPRFNVFKSKTKPKNLQHLRSVTKPQSKNKRHRSHRKQGPAGTGTPRRTEPGLDLCTATFPNVWKEGRKEEEKLSCGVGGAPQAAPKPAVMERARGTQGLQF